MVKLHESRLKLKRLRRADKVENNSEKNNTVEEIKGMLYSLQTISYDKTDRNLEIIDDILEKIQTDPVIKHFEPDKCDNFQHETPHPRTYSELITIDEDKEDNSSLQPSLINNVVQHKKSVRFNFEEIEKERSMSLGITRQLSQELKFRAGSLNRTDSLTRK